MEVPYTFANLQRQLVRRLMEIPDVSKEQAQAEARLLLEAATGLDWQQAYLDPDQAVSEISHETLVHWLYCRAEKRIPVQYLLHEAWFYELKFYVNPHVLIPRPETELLVEAAAQAAGKIQPRPLQIFDLCTGSGCIPVALTAALREAGISDFQIMASDLSKNALKVARLNARQHACAIEFLQGDLLAPVAGRRFDIITCNPPYVDPALKPTLTPEVLDHEPARALFPENGDALHFYQRLASDAAAYLTPGGCLILEIGAGMGAQVQSLFKDAGFLNVNVQSDYAGQERLVIAQS